MSKSGQSCLMINFSNPYITFNNDTLNLDILQEECAELIKSVSKIKRWGPTSYHPDDTDKVTNRDKMLHEIGDVLAMIDTIKSSPYFDFTDVEIDNAKKSKLIKLKDFYQFL